MKLLHLADLHLGKRLNEYSLIEDQKHILGQILDLVAEEKIGACLIAGDVYDKAQPSAEAVALLDYFLTELIKLKSKVFMISGNHDSVERLSFGSQILEDSGLYISRTFTGELEKVTLADEYGPCNIYLLPFLKPAQVRAFFEEAIQSYHDAIKLILATKPLNLQERNILIAHQFVISGSLVPKQSDSELVSVGGLDQVDASLFENFDYVALGHLHRPQKMGKEVIRYAGSPLKYSFSEARHEKVATVIELKEKGNLEIREHPLTPNRDLREIKGPILELLKLGKKDEKGREDYLKITLTDEEEIYDALGQLRAVYPNLMVLDFENSRTTGKSLATSLGTEPTKTSPLDLFAAFYEQQNNEELGHSRQTIIEKVFEEVGEGQ